MEKINKLIYFLLAIANFTKDIHYTCHGKAFYSKHLLADRVYDGIYDFIDSLKETCFLGNDTLPLPSGEYLSRTTSLIPPLTDNDKTNFEALKDLIIETLALIEQIDGTTRAETSLLDSIAQDLQQKLGLINLQVKE